MQHQVLELISNCTSLEIENTSSRKEHAELQDMFTLMTRNRDMVILRELCYTLEEQVCWRAFGYDALKRSQYRFKYLKDGLTRTQVIRILNEFGLETRHINIIKVNGDSFVHSCRPSISAERVRELLSRSLQSREVAENFMKILECFNMIDAGIVNVFRSPWPNRESRYG
jgi:hypothetical protein